MSQIPRKPVAESRRNPVNGQESGQVEPRRSISLSRITNSDVGEASTESSWQGGPHEAVETHHTRQRFRANTVEDLSDDDDSTLRSSLEPPPAYDLQPSEVDVNQEGFHARATASCESEYSSNCDKPPENPLRTGQMMGVWISKSTPVLADFLESSLLLCKASRLLKRNPYLRLPLSLAMLAVSSLH